MSGRKLATVAGACVLVILVFAVFVTPPAGRMEQGFAWARGVLEGCGWEIPTPVERKG